MLQGELCRRLQHFAVSGFAKNLCCNFAAEIKTGWPPALESLARTCDVRPHIAFDCEIANARHRLSKLISALAKSRFCQQKIVETLMR